MWFSKRVEALPPARQSIGVVGSDRGVGVTHTAIAMAMYCRHVIGVKTALYEWNETDAFSDIESICKTKKLDNKSYRLHDIDIYKDGSLGDYLNVAQMDYEYIIIDFGKLSEDNRAHISRCQRCEYVVSLSEWKIDKSMELLLMPCERSIDRQDYLTVFGSEENAKKIKRRFRKDIIRVPYSADAFILSSDMYNVLKSIL